MRFCFILEERYADKRMSLIIADQLMQWGHKVEVLQPHATITSLTELALTDYDAYILKTVSEGPGLTILEAAEAVGIPTINNSRAIRLVRNKAVAVAFAQARGLAIPVTYFVGHPHALADVPRDIYPIVVKPGKHSASRNVHLVRTPEELEQLSLDERTFYLAMRYVENAGYDIKLFVTGQEVHAVMRSSFLHEAIQEREIPVTREMLQIARRVGQIFGLDLYGVDVVSTAKGLVIIDINDFPCFYGVPRRVASVAEYILHAAYRARLERIRNGGFLHMQSRGRLHRQDRKSIQPAELLRSDVPGKRVYTN